MAHAAVVAMAFLACCSSTARASTASVVTDPDDVVRLWVTSDPNDGANDVAISSTPGGFRFIVGDVAITAGAGCLPVDSARVSCDAAGVRVVQVELGAGDDRLVIGDLVYPAEPSPPGEAPVIGVGDTGRDTLIGGAGRDQLRGGPGDDPLIAGEGGNDELSGSDGADVLDGGPDSETSISGGSGVDTVLGGAGDDRAMTGGAGNDTLDGGDGDDDAEGDAGEDTVNGGPGADRLEIGVGRDSEAADGQDVLDGGPGADVIGAGPTAGSTSGDVRPPQGPDSIRGGDGIDTVDFSRRTAPLTIELDGEANDGEADEHDNVQPDVEGVIGGSNGDTLTGSIAANLLDGRDGEDTIEGRGGDDILQGGGNDPSGDNLNGGPGNDTMSGGPGDDSLAGGDGDDSGSGGGGGDTVEGAGGNDSLTGGVGADMVDGGGGNDSLNGGGVILIGGDGPDEVIGGPGADVLLGGRGNDRLDGGLGPDYISGQTERDTVTYEDRTTKVIVTLDGQNNDGEAGERDNVLPDVEVIVGGIRGDDLSGDADANTVDGGRGEDFIAGNLGPDRLLGGTAPDIIRARDGVADEVACGDSGDLAIADDRDKVIECETVDRPHARGLAVGRYALVRPRGEFRLRLPEGRRFFPLTENLKIPIGSTIDPEAGVVRLATARNRAGDRQIASVSAGRFTVHQRGGRRPVTELRLATRFPNCPGSSSRPGRANLAARPSARRLLVDLDQRKRKRKGRDNYTVRGKYSIGGAAGTAWLTEDRCDGTLTTVISGTVHVRDFRRGKTVTVRPGRSYLAMPS
jgi:Ca2+-binding RTX toxin-like protein